MFGLFSSHAEPLAVGAPAPELNVTLDDGSQAQLADYYKSGLTFIFFYPKASTPGCTAQACSLRDAYEKIQAAGVQILGVSSDGTEAQQKFRSKQSLPYPLIADQQKKVIEAFGVPTKMGFASRQAFLVKDGKIVWCDLSAATKKQADDLLAALDKL